jgi:hypothetical protein
MESQKIRVTDRCWCMISWSCTKDMQYVSYPQAICIMFSLPTRTCMFEGLTIVRPVFMHVLILGLVDSHAKKKYGSVVRRSFEGLHLFGIMQVPGHRSRRSGGRHGAPCGHANRAPTTCPLWYLTSLPTSDTIPFLLFHIPTSFKCNIWIALAGIAEVPFFVGLFLLRSSIHVNVNSSCHSTLIDPLNNVRLSFYRFFSSVADTLLFQMFSAVESNNVISLVKEVPAWRIIASLSQ